MAHNWFWRVCRFFLDLIGVRKSDPPIFSLFRLRRSYCIVFRFDCLSCLFSGLSNHKLSSQHLVVPRLTEILTNQRNQASAARNWTLIQMSPRLNCRIPSPLICIRITSIDSFFKEWCQGETMWAGYSAIAPSPLLRFLLHFLKHRDASDNTLALFLLTLERRYILNTIVFFFSPLSFSKVLFWW